MNSTDSKSLSEVLQLYRGIYNRVSRKLGVDPSYVSRVSSEDRNNEAIKHALVEEVRQLVLATQEWLEENTKSEP